MTGYAYDSADDEMGTVADVHSIADRYPPGLRLHAWTALERRTGDHRFHAQRHVQDATIVSEAEPAQYGHAGPGAGADLRALDGRYAAGTKPGASGQQSYGVSLGWPCYGRIPNFRREPLDDTCHWIVGGGRLNGAQ